LFDLSLVIILSPLWLTAIALIWLAILATYGRPVLFRSTRIGLGGGGFVMWKFRTLGLVDKPLGRLATFLRRTHLDELPQVWNVILGSMALVGPRPLVPDDHFSLSNQKQRESIRPGMTGPWQVNRAHKFDYSDMECLDRQLVENESLRLRSAILGKTAVLVLTSLKTSFSGR
ncbi:MAG: sugar transferase, partial [Actinobacteria bacterium]|nr:sugar transferase [Actinomycetota bacterium]